MTKTPFLLGGVHTQNNPWKRLGRSEYIWTVCSAFRQVAMYDLNAPPREHESLELWLPGRWQWTAETAGSIDVQLRSNSYAWTCCCQDIEMCSKIKQCSGPSALALHVELRCLQNALVASVQEVPRTINLWCRVFSWREQLRRQDQPRYVHDLLAIPRIFWSAWHKNENEMISGEMSVSGELKTLIIKNKNNIILWDIFFWSRRNTSLNPGQDKILHPLCTLMSPK